MIATLGPIRCAASILAFTALALAATGCAAIRANEAGERAQEAAETERILTAAGFQIEPADTPERLTQLRTLPAHRVVRSSRDGQPRYVYADPDGCQCLYVGGPKQYEKYKTLTLRAWEKELSEEAPMATEASDPRGYDDFDLSPQP
jgi:hypothetical protein